MKSGDRPPAEKPSEENTVFKRIDHVVIAVKDLDQAVALYRDKFGVQPTQVGRVAEGLKEAELPVGNARIVLTQPVDPDGPIAKFIAERGEGLYLVALEVDSIDKAVQELKGRGARVVETSSATYGRLVFVHPKSAHGVLFQLVERKA